MGLKQKMKNVPWLYNAILGVLNRTSYFNWRFHQGLRTYKLTSYWQKRIETVKASPDNNRLQHVSQAGEIFEDHQLMHNGLKITLGSYYDYGNALLLRDNRGVHEPQEEYAFDLILNKIPEGAVMLELGSYWAFYSMWFKQRVKNARCVMIEPDPHKMNFGKLNFDLNGFEGTFDLGFISNKTETGRNIPLYSVDYLLEKHQIKHLHLLHSDIQGYELKMLEGAHQLLVSQQIDYLFISTHSNELHRQCIGRLQSYSYEILCEADLDASFSVDGLIVAARNGLHGPIEISRRTT